MSWFRKALMKRNEELNKTVVKLTRELEAERKLNAEIKARFVKCNICTSDMKDKCPMVHENLCEGERCEELVDLMSLVEKRDTDDKLEKENAELKEQNEKWFVFETEAGNWGMDKATQYTVDRHNYFYGTKNECQIWAVEHKIKDYTGHKYCYDRLDDQLEQAKELIKEMLPYMPKKNIEGVYEIVTHAEEFIKEIEK